MLNRKISLAAALLTSVAIPVTSIAIPAQAQQAYTLNLSGQGVTATAIVTTNGTGQGVPNSYVADFITGSLIDTNATPSGAATITGLDPANLGGADNNISASSPHVDGQGLSFVASNGASYNYYVDTNIDTLLTGYNNNHGTVTATVALLPSVDTQQTFYDQNSTPLSSRPRRLLMSAMTAMSRTAPRTTQCGLNFPGNSRQSRHQNNPALHRQ
ncbi:MAG TPA: hypothetical protein VKB67_06135 [Rhizomicrobium sp.]|nr:hypothetical protein [Rhizomicrobium sp.]